MKQFFFFVLLMLSFFTEIIQIFDDFVNIDLLDFNKNVLIFFLLALGDLFWTRLCQIQTWQES